MESEEIGGGQEAALEAESSEKKLALDLSEKERKTMWQAWNEELRRGDRLIADFEEDRRVALGDIQEKCVSPLQKAKEGYVAAGGGERSSPAELVENISRAKEKSDEENDESCQKIKGKWSDLKRELSRWFETLQRDGITEEEVGNALAAIETISRNRVGYLEEEFSRLEQLIKKISSEQLNAKDFINSYLSSFEGLEPVRVALSALRKQSDKSWINGVDIKQEAAKALNSRLEALFRLSGSLQNIATETARLRLRSAK